MAAYPGSLDFGPFAIGNIAPDSGIPDENWENLEPPPEVTHFKKPAIYSCLNTEQMDAFVSISVEYPQKAHNLLYNEQIVLDSDRSCRFYRS
ncbi:MAG: hypothetical protein JXA13_01130 [Anaerolineales bacterium]|nr:hypothetical protein [Anaerolineales bacterium]